MTQQILLRHPINELDVRRQLLQQMRRNFLQLPNDSLRQRSENVEERLDKSVRQRISVEGTSQGKDDDASFGRRLLYELPQGLVLDRTRLIALNTPNVDDLG